MSNSESNAASVAPVENGGVNGGEPPARKAQLPHVTDDATTSRKESPNTIVQRGHYFECSRGEWVVTADGRKHTYPASGLSYTSCITKEQRDTIDAAINSIVEGKSLPSETAPIETSSSEIPNNSFVSAPRSAEVATEPAKVADYTTHGILDAAHRLIEQHGEHKLAAKVWNAKVVIPNVPISPPIWWASATPSATGLTEAERACKEIYADFEGFEVRKEPPSVQLAWEVGAALAQRKLPDSGRTDG